jgi:tRNA (cytidine/uridine-2'-O-)-methyltransferase
MAKDQLPRLRGNPLALPPRVVLVEPEIPGNTGSVARLAAALACPLHLVGRLGFRIDEKAVRRAGVDYWHLVHIECHLDLAHFQAAFPDAELKLFSAVGRRSHLEANYRPGDALVFGRESTGLSEEILRGREASTFALPTLGPVRSLNLANAVSIVLYEAMRQLGAFDHLELR